MSLRVPIAKLYVSRIMITLKTKSWICTMR